MTAAALPANEQERLTALESYSIMDTEAEQAYDDVTRIAALICRTPIALVTLLDTHRQWFKARVGLDISETPREDAFCAHAILEPDEVMMVRDATLDQRFVDNPLVTGEPHIRFYAGAPLVTPTGEPLGSVCVIDRTPRELTPEQIAALRALSRQVVTQLELKKSLADLQVKSAEQEAFQEQLERYQMELEAHNARMATEAGTDALTGIHNRRAFDDALRGELARAYRSQAPFSLILLDVDKFKSFNDDFGHVLGDTILRQVAGIIQQQARIYDFVARYGGEEFCVILPGTGPEGSIVMAERTRRAIEKAPWVYREVTVSIGAATLHEGEDTEESLIRRADAALYHAKEHGRNRSQHADQIP
jgi:diguanylate cyclase (GGDEF)-like protein